MNYISSSPYMELIVFAKQQNLNINVCSNNLKILFDFIISNIDWSSIPYSHASIEFIKTFQHKVNWMYVSWGAKLNEDFIEEFQHNVHWAMICINQPLSEKFMRRFFHKMNWTWVSGNQILSEEFIREFADKVEWNGISAYQKLSEEFIIEFYNNINIRYLMNNKILDSNIKEKIKLLHRTIQS